MFEYLPVPCEEECDVSENTVEKKEAGPPAQKPLILQIVIFRIVLLLSAAALLLAVRTFDSPYFERLAREFDYVVRSDTAADEGILSAAEYIIDLLTSPPGEAE